jgi:hypothetical protein
VLTLGLGSVLAVGAFLAYLWAPSAVSVGALGLAVVLCAFGWYVERDRGSTRAKLDSLSVSVLEIRDTLKDYDRVRERVNQAANAGKLAR